jgi:hypothetical protein
MWVSVNEAGAAFALINWYAVPARVRARAVTRGHVVAALAGSGDPASSEAVLRQLPLKRINPFRLIAVFPHSRRVLEWRWDRKRLRCARRQWRPAQWASSGWNESAAQRARAAVFKAARRQATAGTIGWLRRLHRSHRPGRGPSSICMHRDGAATVSYAEIQVRGGRAVMRYHPGPPCATGPTAARAMKLILGRDIAASRRAECLRSRRRETTRTVLRGQSHNSGGTGSGGTSYTSPHLFMNGQNSQGLARGCGIVPPNTEF